MTNIVQAHSWTGEVVDERSCKFYRVFYVGPYAVTQYGSQGNGRTGGKLDFHLLPSAVAAKAEAAELRRKKRSYTTVMELDFQVDLDKLVNALKGGDKAGGEFLDNIHTASGLAQGKDVNVGLADAKARQRAEKGGTVLPSTTEPQAAVTGTDRLTAFGDRALAALTLSTTDVRAATQAYADLTDELEGLQDEFHKAQSFLGTLELMVTEALTK